MSCGAARVWEEAPCPRSETRPKRTSKIFSVNVLCVHFGSRHCSSSSAKRPTGAVDEPPARAAGLASISMHAWLSGSSIGSHRMASRM